MDITTLLGIILGFAVIVWGIGTKSLGNFIDIDSVLITVGGTPMCCPGILFLQTACENRGAFQNTSVRQ